MTCTHHQTTEGVKIYEDTYVEIAFAFCEECSATGAVIKEYYDDTGNFEISEFVWS